MAIRWRLAFSAIALLGALQAVPFSVPMARAQVPQGCHECAKEENALWNGQADLRLLESHLQTAVSDAEKIGNAILDRKGQAPTAAEREELSKLDKGRKELEQKISAARDAVKKLRDALDACVKENCEPPIDPNAPLPEAPATHPEPVAVCPACDDIAKKAQEVLRDLLFLESDIGTMRLAGFELSDWLAKHASEQGSARYQLRADELRKNGTNLKRAEIDREYKQRKLDKLMQALAICNATRCKPLLTTGAIGFTPAQAEEKPKANCPECERAALTLKRDLAQLRLYRNLYALDIAKRDALAGKLADGTQKPTQADRDELREIESKLKDQERTLADIEQRTEQDRTDLDACNKEHPSSSCQPPTGQNVVPGGRAGPLPGGGSNQPVGPGATPPPPSGGTSTLPGGAGGAPGTGGKGGTDKPPPPKSPPAGGPGAPPPPPKGTAPPQVPVPGSTGMLPGVPGTSVDINTENAAFVTRTAGGDALPSTTLDISLMGNGGKDVHVQAVTGTTGTLPVSIVPWTQWQDGSAFRNGALSLPDGSFGTVLNRDASTGVGMRQPFAILNGNFIDPGRYALNLVSPFSLFCRSDEGLQKTLETGERFTFDVPGSESALYDVLGRKFVVDPHYYHLPERNGYSVSVAAGANPGATWSALQGLVGTGNIVYLEKDPCEHFLPDAPVAAGGSCVPGKKEFPEKAVHLSGSFGATLLGPNGAVPVPGASVIYGPLSPSPFFNPGDRPGDDQPPTIVRTGSNGAYSAPLTGLNGPIEIGVAKGCDEHTTVAIADGPATGSGAGTTTTTTTTTTTNQGGGGTSVTPGGGTPSTVAKPPGGNPVPVTTAKKPNPDEKVCGPDITDWVMGTLEFMVETFNSWDEDTKDAKCRSLYRLGADGAWDMRLMTPYESPAGDKGQYVYFGRDFPDVCAVPAWPCGATVQFLGVCLNAQIVNYVQWGAVNQMCSKQSNGIMMHSLRDRLSNWEHFFFHSTVYDAQDLMSFIGERFAQGHEGLADRKKSLEEMVRQGVAKLPDIAKTDGFDCPLTCGKYAPNLNVLDGKDWGFKWGDDWYDRRGSQLRKP